MKLSDFTYVQQEDVPHGKAVIIGMMADGPTGVPFTLNENGSATFFLGDNEVSRAYNLLIENGASTEDIILFRLNGVPAQAQIEIDDEVALTLQAMASHSEDQRITFTVSEEGVALKSNYSEDALESGRRKDFTRTYLFDEHPYLSDLAEAITADAAIGIHGVMAEYNQVRPSRDLVQVTGPRAFLYGNDEEALTIRDGLFPAGSIDEEGSYLYDYWERFYYHLLGPDFDGESSSKVLDIAAEVLYFADAPIDDLPELAILAGRVAEQKTHEQDILCTALFRTNTLPQERVLGEDEYMNQDGTFYNDDTGEDEVWAPKAEQEAFIEKLTHLFTEEERDFTEMNNVQIVVGDEYTSLGEIIPGAAHHLSHLISQDLLSSTNQELASFQRIHAILDKNQIDKLRAKGYICIVDSIRRNAVTSKVQTPYNARNLKEAFYFRKTLSYIAYDIRNLLDKYIGQALTIQSVATIEELLSEYLSQYVEQRLIASFALGEGVTDAVAHTSNISIEIIMYGEVDSVKGSVQLNEEGWEVDLWNI